MLASNERFTCSRSMPSLCGDHYYCAAFGGGCQQCDGESPTCRIRARQLRRHELWVSFTDWLQKKRGIVPHVPTPVECFIGSINNLIARCPHEKSDETAMEREAEGEQPEKRRLAGLHAETAIVDELGKVMQEKSEGEGASWGTSQQVTDADSTSATASKTSASTEAATGER